MIGRHRRARARDAERWRRAVITVTLRSGMRGNVEYVHQGARVPLNELLRTPGRLIEGERGVQVCLEFDGEDPPWSLGVPPEWW